jgi:pyrophosphatase PpaX
MRYSTILFDLDGTLINTNDLILASFMHTLEKHCPGKYTEADVIARMGEPLKEQMKYFDKTQSEEMVKTYQKHNAETHDHYVKEFPHVKEVLVSLHQAGVTMGVVSNKRREMVEKGLRYFGLDTLMKVVVCVDDVKQAKPAPDMICLALEKLGVSREEVLMVGDSRYDLLAAQRAQVDSAAVGWSLHKDELLTNQPTHFLNDMRDLLTIQNI